MKTGIIYLATDVCRKFGKDFCCICGPCFCEDAAKGDKPFTAPSESIGCALSANVHVRQMEDWEWVVGPSCKMDIVYGTAK